MYLQAFLSPAVDIVPLYESEHTNSRGKTEYHIKKTPTPRAKKLAPYIAKLYRPGKRNPYRTQRAGRELLESPQKNGSLVATVSTTNADVPPIVPPGTLAP